MKNLLKLPIVILLILFANTVNGQKLSKSEQHRLSPILKSVQVNEKEKEKIVDVIREFQENAQKIRQINSESKKTKLKSNRKEYMKNIKQILKPQRFLKWREYVKKKNQ